MKKVIIAVSLLSTAISPAHAGEYVSKITSPSEKDEIRYYKGDQTITRSTPTSVITIAPLPNDNGRPAFGITIVNLGESSINFGQENVSVLANGVAVPILTKKQLAQKAANAAMWASLAGAMVAGLSAVDYGSTTTSGYVGRTPVYIKTRSSYASSYEANRINAELQSEIRAATDARLADAAENVLDTTTIDPGDSYGGKIILDKPKSKVWPLPTTITVNGESFAFTMSK